MTDENLVMLYCPPGFAHGFCVVSEVADVTYMLDAYYDPATQYKFAQRMASELGNATLVSVDAFGHCILGGSTCVDKIAARYLIDLQVPGPGTVCGPNVQPFPGLPPAPPAPKP